MQTVVPQNLCQDEYRDVEVFRPHKYRFEGLSSQNGVIPPQHLNPSLEALEACLPWRAVLRTLA